jgi:hypothetical protein
MTEGHREMITHFSQLGRNLGYTVRPTFEQAWPTDGVWLCRSVEAAGLPAIPVVAAECLVSERGKTLSGSVMTLEMVSPALAVIIVNDEEIFRGMIRSGGCEADVAARLATDRTRLEALTSKSRQRFAIWKMSELRRRATLTGTGEL